MRLKSRRNSGALYHGRQGPKRFADATTSARVRR